MTEQNNSGKPYRLYVRLGCHLCEDAARALAAAHIAFERVDIDRNPRLASEYGAIIPVLHDTVRDCEWVYPFTAAQILAALNLKGV